MEIRWFRARFFPRSMCSLFKSGDRDEGNLGKEDRILVSFHLVRKAEHSSSEISILKFGYVRFAV